MSPDTSNGTTAYLTPSERADVGRSARRSVPRSVHGDWGTTPNRRDPLEILEAQEVTRVQELVPIRHARMAESPFAFFRGAAAVMAADLELMPRSGLAVQLCGDAHLSNFGGFASPERDLVFDVNDFDETHTGPFEWDLKRLGASLEIAGRARNFTASERCSAVAQAIRSYREAIRSFAQLRALEIWNSHLDVDAIIARWGAEGGKAMVRNLLRTATKAESKDHLKAFGKLVKRDGDELRFASDPPLLVPVEEIFSDTSAREMEEIITGGLRSYRRTLQGDRRRLLDRYRYLHLARKVVGVGSVGTRCWVVLLVGRDEEDPLFLQVKQAEESVLEPYLGKSRYSNHGQRVVEGQRLMQGASDILLGWERLRAPDGVMRDFYFRQLWDWKTSVNVDAMPLATFGIYGQICGWTLARAHARSGDPVAIGAYLGSSDVFDRAMTRFAVDYADRNELDHRELVTAISSGQIQAEESAALAG